MSWLRLYGRSGRYRSDEHAKQSWYATDIRSVQEKDGSYTIYSVLNNITPQITAQAEKERNRTMYELAAEIAGLYLWRYDVASHEIHMYDTKATRKLRDQYDIPEVITDVPVTDAKWIAPEDYEKYKEIYTKIEQGQKQVSCEYWYKPSSDGRQHCEYIVYHTVFDENGHPQYAYGIGQDITIRRIEERNYRRLYQQIAEANPDSVCFFRLNLTKNTCGEGQSKYPRLLALQEDGTFTGMFDRVITAIEDMDAKQSCRRTFDRMALLEDFQNGIRDIEREIPVHTFHDEYRWYKINCHIVQNPETGDIEAAASAVDITKRKTDEQIIQLITMQNHDFIGIIDVASGTISLHDGVWGSHGLLSDQLLAYTMAVDEYAEDYVAPEERTTFLNAVSIDHLVAGLKYGSRPLITYTLVTEDGTELKKQLYYTWLDHTEREIMLLQSDITEAYQQEQRRTKQLKEALDMAEKANNAKSDFVSRISHDIRTPLSAITSMTDFAMQDMDDHDKISDDLKKIKSANTFLLSLINDILDISKIDSGQIELHPEAYSCNECMENIRNMFTPLCRKKNLNFETVIHGGEEVLYVDKIRLNQIVLNLVSNSIKYTPENGTVHVEMNSYPVNTDELAFVFEVRDTGIGMSEEFQKTMFNPFTQDEDNPERLKLAGGTGLGLSIVKKLVTLMNGTITVDSHMNQGSKIVVNCILPQYDGRKEEAEGIEDVSAAEEILHGTVLLAEDNQINAEIASRLLESIGLKCVHAVNGEKAVKLFQASAPDDYICILMDIRMPVMNGHDAARAIRDLDRSDAKDIPIIALTADAIHEDTKKAYDSGMNAYLTKPIDLQKLKKTIQQLAKKE